jgi:hypothetical protein
MTRKGNPVARRANAKPRGSHIGGSRATERTRMHPRQTVQDKGSLPGRVPRKKSRAPSLVYNSKYFRSGVRRWVRARRDRVLLRCISSCGNKSGYVKTVLLDPCCWSLRIANIPISALRPTTTYVSISCAARRSWKLQGSTLLNSRTRRPT